MATRSGLPEANGFYAPNKQVMSRSPHVARDNISTLQIGIPNWYVNAGLVEVGTGAEATVTASIEYPAGTFTQLKFAGAMTGHIPDGDTLYSDPVAVHILIASQFWVRIFWQNSAGVIYIQNAYNDVATGGCELTPSGGVDKTMGGTVPASMYNLLPVAILGYTRRPSIYVCGDSRSFGVNDTADTSLDMGIICRSIGADFAYINGSASGDSLQRFFASHARRLELSRFCSHIVNALGINDVGAGRTAGQIQADYVSVNTLFPGKPVFGVTLNPQSTSTDNWATITRQTPFTRNAVRIAINDWQRSRMAPTFSGYFEIADVVESARNSGQWIVNGSANYATSDGVHETQAICLLIKSSSAIPGWMITR